MDEERRAGAEAIIGHTFADPALLDAALTHPSYAAEHPEAAGYDRLEFLGDAVLGMIVSDVLFARLPEAPEGELTRRKHSVVSGEALAAVAAELGLGVFVRLGRGADSPADRARLSLLENVLEAVIGALYLDGGLEAASAFAARALGSRVSVTHVPDPDPKSALQQLTQGRLGALPEYEVTDISGPPHERSFSVDVMVRSQVVGTGHGASKQAAEKAAAAAALANLSNPSRDTASGR